MKKHNGIRPQDVLILLKIASHLYGSPFFWDNWLGRKETQEIRVLPVKSFPFKKEIASQLQISASEVTESLARSAYSGLYDPINKRIMGRAFFEFLQYGLKYVFPQQPGALARGMPTAHSAKPLSDIIQSDEPYVWPSSEGTVRGQSIEPLYPTVVQAVTRDPMLYEMLALVDAIRIGKAREVQIAVDELRKRLLPAP
jgi:hypothetical protein